MKYCIGVMWITLTFFFNVFYLDISCLTLPYCAGFHFPHSEFLLNTFMVFVTAERGFSGKLKVVSVSRRFSLLLSVCFRHRLGEEIETSHPPWLQSIAPFAETHLRTSSVSTNSHQVQEWNAVLLWARSSCTLQNWSASKGRNIII